MARTWTQLFQHLLHDGESEGLPLHLHRQPVHVRDGVDRVLPREDLRRVYDPVHVWGDKVVGDAGVGIELVVGGGTDEGDAVAAAGQLEGQGLPDNLLNGGKNTDPIQV